MHEASDFGSVPKQSRENRKFRSELGEEIPKARCNVSGRTSTRVPVSRNMTVKLSIILLLIAEPPGQPSACFM